MTTPNSADAGSGDVVAATFSGSPGVHISRWGRTTSHAGDRIFRGLSQASGLLIVGLLAAIGLFLLWGALPALSRNQENFFTYGGTWATTGSSAIRFGILEQLQVTVFVSTFALVVAMPVALGVAIYLTQYAPRKLAAPMSYLVDLLAAVPSIIYGVWGLHVLAPQLRPLTTWLNLQLGDIFLFAPGNASVPGGGTIFTAGIVLAVMILPVITAVTRQVFLRTPLDQIEAALALGATRWELVRTTVLPFGRSGFVSGAVLGLGRALGETMALLIILRGTPEAFAWSLFDGGSTFATKIAAAAPAFANQYQAGAYIAAGLVLFLLTFGVNAVARSAVAGARGGKAR